MYTVTLNKNKGINSIIEGLSYEKLSAKLNFLDKDERENLLSSSKKILENCIPPTIDKSKHKFNDTTGLVFGYVQSGKTLSFTTVMALAQDNDYRIAILIAGRTNLLLSQNTERLKNDIGDNKNISIISNVSDLGFVQNIQKKLNNPRGKLLIITVLKHQKHIENLSILFKDVNLKSALNNKSILIFDDESDQASLNTLAKSNELKNLTDESAIFSSIKLLRGVIPNHSYIQYTATPQANLLIDYIDLLSPDWHVLLEPGKSYTGGSTFFKKSKTKKLIYNIPDKERFHYKDNNLDIPPSGLINSIYNFIFSSIFLCYDDFDLIPDKFNKKLSTTSMMIHPCYRQESIAKFVKWTKSILEGIQESIYNNNYKKIDEMYKKYLMEYHDIFINIPDIETVVNFIDEEFLSSYKVHEVVGGMEKEPFDWKFCNHHILVGGQLLDRGFTVENLIVTYMPRDTKGKNNADTIEQRCRFFGYKKNYIDLCEVYIPFGLQSDYESYVDHEINLRSVLSKINLSEFKNSGSPMLTGINLNLTNSSRIGSGLRTEQLKGFQYFEPPLNIEKNNEIINEFINDINVKDFADLMPELPIDQKSNSKHKVVKIDLNKILLLLSKIDIGNSYEVIKKSNYERYIHHLIENCNQNFAWLILISPERKYGRPRTVNFDSNESYKNPYKISSLASNYPSYFGDSKLLKTKEAQRDKFNFNEELILQIHKIEATENTNKKDNIYGKSFYTLAFNFSDKFAQTFVTKNSN